MLCGLADVYRDGVHVGDAAWDKNWSGGLYGRIANITHNNLHSYINGTHTTSISWFTPEFEENSKTPGVPKLKWEK